MARLREGRAHTARGAAHSCARRCPGATSPSPGFYTHAVRPRRMDVRFSTHPFRDEDAWTPIVMWPYTPFEWMPRRFAAQRSAGEAHARIPTGRGRLAYPNWETIRDHRGVGLSWPLRRQRRLRPAGRRGSV